MYMPVRKNSLKLVSYVPHGAVPDLRGFAPSIAAYNLVKNFEQLSAVTICNRERYKKCYEVDPEIGPIYRIKNGRLYRRLFRKITRFDPYPLHARAAKIVDRISPDIFHAHQVEFPVDDFLKKITGKIPVIVHAHVTNRTFSCKRGIADRYIAVSNYVKERLAQQGYPENRIAVIHNGVDVALFKPAQGMEKVSIKRSLRIPEETFVVSFIGRMQEVKGFHIFLQAAETLLSKYPRIYVLAAGPEPDDAKKERSYSLRMDLRMRLCGSYGDRYREFLSLPHSELSNIYKITDVSLLPSLSEPQGMAMIESMASGCITVSSNVGGIRESIANGTTGFLLDDPNNVDEGLQLVEELVQHSQKYEIIKRNAREFAVNNFDWTISAGKLEKLCLAVINEAQ
jgi:UDP-N-acetylglucosamine:(glucosyl)LPS alpha-1,2-N-acetylglucosaminyltransferase